MKGIILAAGKGTRLYPLTRAISKPLLPIYDKPMIYYPLSTLINADIKDILIITNEIDLPLFQRALGPGEEFGVNISYKIQYVQRGIADAFIIGEDFIGNDNVALILGDNIFYHEHLASKFPQSIDGALVFAKYVSDPERFGIVEFDESNRAISLEEKPHNPKSNYAVTGLYFYDNTVCSKAKALQPSARGELEITDINKLYLKERKLSVSLLGPDVLWMDAGTFDSILEAGNVIKNMQEERGIIIGNVNK